jgi:hypothetical protein
MSGWDGKPDRVFFVPQPTLLVLNCECGRQEKCVKKIPDSKFTKNSRKLGRPGPTSKMNARLSDSEVRGLIRSRGLGYVPVQEKRPFIIPIPHAIRGDGHFHAK